MWEYAVRVSTVKSISTNQIGVNEALADVVALHRESNSQRPIAKHNYEAFDSVLSWLTNWSGKVVLDLCCGVGESTRYLAKRNPNAKVIGIDKSIARLNKHHAYQNSESVENYQLFQADLNDFWRLLCAHTAQNHCEWYVQKQCIWYPNPYPKKSQLRKRWHGSAIFPYIMRTSKCIELRSNWRLYLEEFMQAAAMYEFDGVITEITQSPVTPFERKYMGDTQTCYQLMLRARG